LQKGIEGRFFNGACQYEDTWRVLFTAIAVLVACHAIVMTCYWETFCMGSRGAILDFGYLFDLSKEKNVPTWFSTSLLTAVGLLLVLVALIARRRAPRLGPGPVWARCSVICRWMKRPNCTGSGAIWCMARG
jgi:hypothetical protein